MIGESTTTVSTPIDFSTTMQPSSTTPVPNLPPVKYYKWYDNPQLQHLPLKQQQWKLQNQQPQNPHNYRYNKTLNNNNGSSETQQPLSPQTTAGYEKPTTTTTTSYETTNDFSKTNNQ
ncbi:hypothetical protein CVS40_0694 [Lucilia cuprina]|nr:hypothetical protein CVS40_0694 [Lucilia cuprina]